jgi:hypothetical protein
MISIPLAPTLPVSPIFLQGETRGGNGRHKPMHFAYGAERFQASAREREADNLIKIPSLNQALNNLYGGRIKKEITSPDTGLSLLMNPSLIAERVMHFTFKL